MKYVFKPVLKMLYFFHPKPYSFINRFYSEWTNNLSMPSENTAIYIPLQIKFLHLYDGKNENKIFQIHNLTEKF